jgi:hypothetical protein
MGESGECWGKQMRLSEKNEKGRTLICIEYV